MDKQTALKRFTTSRKKLLKAISCLNEADILSRPLDGIWTCKDLLAHIHSWEMTLIEPLRVFTQTGQFPVQVIPDHLAWNDQQALLWKNRPLAVILEDLSLSHGETLALAEQMTDSQWQQVFDAPWGGQCTIADMIAGLAWHANAHIKKIK